MVWLYVPLAGTGIVLPLTTTVDEFEEIDVVSVLLVVLGAVGVDGGLVLTT
jgi:hypothetical protein